MPLTDHVGAIAATAQQFRKGWQILSEVSFVARDTTLVRRRPLRHVAETVAMGVHTRHEHRASRRATGMRVKVGEAHAALSERVDIRRGDFSAKSAEIRVAEIISQNNHNVRWGGAF